MLRNVWRSLLAAWALALGPTTLPATAWNVPGDFATIQGAIDGAAAGDSILISGGEYQENLVVTKPLTLIGAGVDGTVLYPAVSDIGSAAPPSFGHSQLAVIQAAYVTLRDLTLDGDSPYLTPVGVLDARNGIITDYTLGNWHGLRVESCRVKNIYLRAVYAVAQAGTLTGIAFTETEVENVRGWDYQSAALMFFNVQGEITHCSAVDASLGIMLQAGCCGSVLRNTLNRCDAAIAVNSNTGAVLVADNIITNYGDTGFQAVEPGAALAVRRNEITTRIEPGATDQAAIYVFSQKTGNLETQVYEDNALWRSALPGAGRQRIRRPRIALESPLQPAGDRVTGWGLVVDSYGWSASHDVHVRIAGNSFDNFESGILLVDTHGSTAPLMDVVIGGAPGESNTFYGSSSYELALQSQDEDVDARYNDWGVYWPGGIEEEVYHQLDDPALGLVDFSEWLGGGSGVGEMEIKPARLHGADPNPFRGEVRITCGFRPPGPATLRIYDVQGRLLRVLADAPTASDPSVFRWKGDDAAGRQLPAGLYLYKVESAGRGAAGRVVLIR